MSILHHSLRCPAILAVIYSASQLAQAATNALPASAAAPPGSATERGWIVRTVQAPETNEVANSFIRAIKQLNGTLRTASGALVPNEATPGKNADGSYNVDVINFEKDGSPIDVLDADGNVPVSFAPELFPGIPGAGGHTTRFAVEVIGFLELAAGNHTFGVSVGTDRTDVNNDDSYQVFVAANPRDFFAVKVGEFERFAPPFRADTHTESQFTISVPAAGIYPFRLVYWQTGLGASLQWYSILPGSGERVLINDSNDARALKSYRKINVARAASPYVGEVSPLPGSAANDASAPIQAVLFDGAAAINDSSVNLSLNGTTVVPQTRQRTGKQLFLQYDPNVTRADPNNQLRLVFADTGGATYTNAWAFTINVLGGSSTKVTGQWDFEKGDLSASAGLPLEFLDGTNGVTSAKTRFGTTTSFGIADIKGKPAKVMFVPGDLDRRIGYNMRHGIAPNGGGTRVNQYTLILDVFVAAAGPGAASLLQVSSLNNTDDGDLFWQGNNFGQGTGGYVGTGAFTAGEWHRVAAAYDMAANPPVVTKYVDGIKQDDWTANQGLDNPRRALLAAAILFGDGDQDERREMYVNSIQIRSGKLADAQMVLLGGPSVEGIPADLPESNVTGQWDFDRGDLSATVGKALRYLDGTNGVTQAGTQFGTATDLSVGLINGQEARIIKVPGDLDRNIGYLMEHGIAPNGGGTRVNQYTLIMDVMVGTTGPGAAAIWQTSSLNNTDDGDLFWQGSNFGQGTSGYVGTGAFTAGAWHRIAAAYDMAAKPPVVVKYVDGVFQDNWTANQGLDNPRRALQPTAILFADGDQDERREWWVNSIQIRSGRLSNTEMEALGGPSANGIPIALASPPSSPALQISRSGNTLTIAWPAAAAGYTLESSTTLTNPKWTPVAGVVNNSATIAISGNAQFLRLRK
jgi:hypothetical protein